MKTKLISITAIFLLSLSMGLLLSSCGDDDSVDACASLELTAIGSAFSVKASATGGTAPYEFSIDGTTFQSGAEFKNVAVQDYTVTVKDAGGCTKTAAVSAASLQQFVDERDNRSYKAVKIGEQIWMGENLRVDPDSAAFKCYDDVAENCEKYGLMYTWHAAQVACPKNWSLPSFDDYDILFEAIGGDDDAAKVQKLIKGGSSGFDTELGGAYYDDKFQLIDEWDVLWATGVSLDDTEGRNIFIGPKDEVVSASSTLPKEDFACLRCLKDK